MEQYQYRAVDSAGGVHHGVLTAATSDEASDILESDGLAVTRIYPKKALFIPRLRRAPWKKKRIISFSKEFVSLINSGVDVYRSVQFIQSLESDQNIKKDLAVILSCLHQGQSLSASFLKLNLQIDPMFINSLIIGEEASGYVKPLNQYIQKAESSLDVYQKMLSATYYPIFLIAFSLVSLLLLSYFVIPNFESVYQDAQVEMPVITQFTLGIANHALEVVVLVCASVLMIYWGRRSPLVQRLVGLVPGLKTLSLAHEYWQLSRTLLLFLESGGSLQNALAKSLELVEPQRRDALKRVLDKVESGKRFSTAAFEEAVLPEKDIQLIQVGEHSGDLSTMLATIEARHSASISRTLDALSKLAEPVAMVLVGGLIGGLIVALYLPIFGMLSLVG